MRRTLIGLLIAALPLVVAAQEPPKPAQTPAPTAPAQTAAFPKGAFTTTLGDGTVLDVTFGEGTLSVWANGQPLAEGKYATKGDQFVVSDTSDSCAAAGEGTYTWAFDGKSLTFKGSKDACQQRADILNVYAFVKKQ